MLLIGTDDGVYETQAASGSRTARVRRRLSSGRVMRLRRLAGTVYAATADGLYRQTDDGWDRLPVPETAVYAVGTDGDRLFAGTRPAHLYAAPVDRADEAAAWTEVTGLQSVPSRDAWRLPRHDDLAQLRDVTYDAATDRLAVGVEVGGVLLSDDGGETFRECTVADDVHELRVVGPGEYVAATGRGLYRSRNGGESWRRLDEDVPQRYFRRTNATGDAVYASGALANSSTWNDADADPGLFRLDADGLTRVPLPRDDETVTGMTTLDGSLVVVTHTGSVFRPDDGREFPPVPVVAGRSTGRYTPAVPTEA